MTGVRAGSGGTGLLEGSRPGTGVTGITLTPYDLAVLALGPDIHFADMSIGPYVEPATYEEVMAGLGPHIHFATMDVY